MISSKHPTGLPLNFLTRKNSMQMDNAMLDYQALCWWLYIYVDGILKDLANLFQLVISTPSITCPLSNKHPSFSLEFKISEEIRYRKNNAKYKGNSPGKQRLGETWRIYIISKELYCFTPLLTNKCKSRSKSKCYQRMGHKKKSFQPPPVQRLIHKICVGTL